MFTRQSFGSSWERLLKAFDKTYNVAPVVDINCLDGSSVRVYKMLPAETCLFLEIYTKSEKTEIKLLPYDQITSIDLKTGSDEQLNERAPLGFPIPKNS
jgi:hypothetical protein